MKKAFLIAAFFILSAKAIFAQTEQDKKEVERALLDYIEGFYEGDTVKLTRSIPPHFIKYGYWKDDKTAKYGGEGMSYQAMNNYANNVKARNRQQPPTAIKKVEVFDVQEQVASGKVTAWWGIDYILLEKTNGKWQIRNVLWQGPIATIKQ
jgi:hypothetical protein